MFPPFSPRVTRPRVTGGKKEAGYPGENTYVRTILIPYVKCNVPQGRPLSRIGRIRGKCLPSLFLFGRHLPQDSSSWGKSRGCGLAGGKKETTVTVRGERRGGLLLPVGKSCDNFRVVSLFCHVPSSRLSRSCRTNKSIQNSELIHVPNFSPARNSGSL